MVLLLIIIIINLSIGNAMVTAMNSSFASLPLPLSLLKNVGRAAARLLTCSAEHGAREICTLEREEAHRNTCSGGKYFHAL
jgi:hypothetical protein